jgi:hypothetical protein
MIRERSPEVVRFAQKVADGSIVAQATERLIYQIVEVCAEHEKETLAALRSQNAELVAALEEARHEAVSHSARRSLAETVNEDIAEDNAELVAALEESVALNENFVSVSEAETLSHLSEYKAVIKQARAALAAAGRP